MNPSKHELKKVIAEVNKLSNSIPISMGNNTQINETNTTNETGPTMGVTIKTITQIQTDKVITEDGKKAPLFNPLPCLFWKCTGTPNTAGVITLKKKLTGLFIYQDDNYYCLGVNGDSNEFELRSVIGNSEIRINNLFINMITQHFIKNGLEV